MLIETMLKLKGERREKSLPAVSDEFHSILNVNCPCQGWLYPFLLFILLKRKLLSLDAFQCHRFKQQIFKEDAPRLFCKDFVFVEFLFL